MNQSRAREMCRLDVLAFFVRFGRRCPSVCSFASASAGDEERYSRSCSQESDESFGKSCLLSMTVMSRHNSNKPPVESLGKQRRERVALQPGTYVASLLFEMGDSVGATTHRIHHESHRWNITVDFAQCKTSPSPN
jgi:hypothetical protein